MNDYMRALHQRFYREPDFSELEEDIENTRQEVRDCLDKLHRRVQTGLGTEQRTGSGRPVLLR